VQGMGRDTTLTGRTRIWHSVLSVAESPLVGTGFESFWIGPRYDQVKESAGIEVNQAHNGYLETYLNLGWIGVGFMGIVLFAGYARIVKAVRNLAPFASLRVAFFMIIITENFTEASFGMAGPVWIAFLLSAMAPVDAAAQPEPEPDQERSNRIEAPWMRKPTRTTPLVPVGSAVVPHSYRAKPQRTRQ
ncbi:MAG: O-antigen ligase family protein, partial [Candidatus Acidiferrum sp.]